MKKRRSSAGFLAFLWIAGAGLHSFSEAAAPAAAPAASAPTAPVDPTAPILDMDFEQMADGKVGFGGSLATAAGIKEWGTHVFQTEGRRGFGVQFKDVSTEKKEEGCVEANVPMDTFDKGFTAEAWIKPDFSHPMKMAACLIGTMKSDPGPGFLFLIYKSRQLGILVANADNTKKVGISGRGPRLEDGQWQHVAVTYDGSIFTTFIDGKQAAQSAPNTPMVPSYDMTVSIGSYHLGYWYGYEGSMDDVKLFNYARTAEQIAADAQPASS